VPHERQNCISEDVPELLLLFWGKLISIACARQLNKDDAAIGRKRPVAQVDQARLERPKRNPREWMDCFRNYELSRATTEMRSR
jgi:hypothetical protein